MRLVHRIAASAVTLLFAASAIAQQPKLSGGPEDPDGAGTSTTPPYPTPWVWVGTNGSSENRYVNVGSVRREWPYVKYLVLFKTAQYPDPEYRQVTLDCKAKKRAELDEDESFEPSALRSFFPDTVVGSESQWVCDEADRRGR